MDRRKLIKTMTFALGATIATPTLMSLLSSCNSKAESNWNPLFLDSKKGEVLQQLSNIILPTNATLAINIPKFIDLVLNDVISPSEQQLFLNGAVAFEEAFERKYHTSIHKGTTDELENLLSHYFRVSVEEKTAIESMLSNVQHPQKKNDKQLIYSYLFFIREYSIWGYATANPVHRNN